jgi:hypothetical protein
MAVLTWDGAGERIYETGVDRGVLYIPDSSGAYTDGVAWNGLVTVTETPSGAEPNAQYADNVKYLNLFSAEEFGGTIEAFTYPDEFAPFDGLGVPAPGLTIGQQARRTFGLSYRTKLGNDIDGDDYGYKLHLVYGCSASPSEKAYTTINDSPEAITFSWELTTVPVAVTNARPTSILTVDSTMVDSGDLEILENFLYGTAGTDPSLPLPNAVVSIFSGTAVQVTPTEPAFNSATNTITIPSVTGVTYYIDNVAQSAGAVVITEDTVVTARPNNGYYFPANVDDDWFYDFD